MDTNETKNVAFLGLGVMGYPMAGHLARAGHRVTVYNRTAAKARAMGRSSTAAGARRRRQPRRPAPRSCMMCVGNDDDVRAVVLGAERRARRHARRLDPRRPHHRLGAGIAREIHAAAKALQIGFLDAPVSGGQAGAENGKLTVMVGGDADAFGRAERALAHYARAVTLMGGPGSGQLTKMVNQICIAGLVQALAEGVHFAEKAGLDVERALDVIGKGAAQSWQMDNRGKTMLADKFDFGFAVDWMRKDLALCLAEARTQGATLPVTALVDQFYARGAGAGRRAVGLVEPDPRAARRALKSVRASPRARRISRPAPARCRRRPCAISNVTSAVFASIAVAEQYLSFDSLHRPLDVGPIEPAPGDRVPEMDPREDPGLGPGALGVGLDRAVRDRLARLPEDQHDVERGAGGGAEQDHLHRAHPAVAPAVLRRAVDDDRVAAFGFADEAHALGPFCPDLHSFLAILDEAAIVPHRRGGSPGVHRAACRPGIPGCARRPLAIAATVCQHHNRSRGVGRPPCSPRTVPPCLLLGRKPRSAARLRTALFFGQAGGGGPCLDRNADNG